MSRLSALADLEQEHYYRTLLRKLTRFDRAMTKLFIEENDSLDFPEFELKLDFWFMDVREKPRNWTIMKEVASAANGRNFR